MPDTVDNCPNVFNPDQLDQDGDGPGNVCDNCASTANLDQLDGDNDAYGNVCDNCLNVNNPLQADGDADGIGDECDELGNVMSIFWDNSDGLGGYGFRNTTNSADSATARFFYPREISFANGEIYVADYTNMAIRKVTTDGIVSTAMGGTKYSCKSIGLSGNGRFYYPSTLAIGSNKAYVVDQCANIKELELSGASAGQYNVVCGVAVGSNGATDDCASSTAIGAGANLRSCIDDVNGNLFFVDQSRHIIRRFDIVEHQIYTIAGTSNNPGNTDGAGHEALFNTPRSCAISSDGNTIYITDEKNYRIRKLTGVLSAVSGNEVTVSTLAGSVYGATSGALADTKFSSPWGIVIDPTNDNVLYVSDLGKVTRLRKINLSVVGKEVSTVANLGSPPQMVDMTISDDGLTIYSTSDYKYSHITKVDLAQPQPLITVLAGGSGGYALHWNDYDNFVTTPADLASDGAGGLYVTDHHRATLRKITLGETTQITTVATGIEARAAVYGCEDSDCYVYAIKDASVEGITNRCVIKVLVNGPDIGSVFDLAGNCATKGNIPDGAVSVAGTDARFDFGHEYGYDMIRAGDNLYFTDTINNKVRTVNRMTGQTSTLTGEISKPESIAVNPYLATPDYIYVGNHFGVIYKVYLSDGTTVKIAGTGIPGNAEGPAISTNIGRPSSLTHDGRYIYMLDATYNNIKRVEEGGTVQIFVGDGQKGLKAGSGPAETGISSGLDTITFDPFSYQLYLVGIWESSIMKIN